MVSHLLDAVDPGSRQFCQNLASTKQQQQNQSRRKQTKTQTQWKILLKSCRLDSCWHTLHAYSPWTHTSGCAKHAITIAYCPWIFRCPNERLALNSCAQSRIGARGNSCALLSGAVDEQGPQHKYSDMETASNTICMRMRCVIPLQQAMLGTNPQCKSKLVPVSFRV